MATFQHKRKNKTREASWCSFPNENVKAIAEREELNFINLILKHKSIVQDAVSSGVRYDYFWHSDTSDFYKIIAKYFDSYKSLLTKEQFRNEIDVLFSNEEDRVYFKSKYEDIISRDVSEYDYPALKDNLGVRLSQLKIYDITQKHFHSILEGGDKVKQDIESYVQDVSGVKFLSGESYTKTVNLKESLDDVWVAIEDRRDNPEAYHGLKCGIKCLDNVYNGFGRGQYMVISGMPNGGKTSVMFNMCMNMALNGHNVVYVTIESNHHMASQRILCIYAGVDENRIFKGGRGSDGLTDDIMIELRKAKDELSKLENFSWIQAAQGIKSGTIIEMIEQKRTFTDVDVVFVDYLDVIGRDKIIPGRPDLELVHVSRTFQAYGKTNDILVITAQQLKNDVVKKMQKSKDSFSAFDAGVGDLSGSQIISADADYVFAILLDQNTRDRLYFRSSKVRHGSSLDKFAVSFDRNSGRLMDMPGGDGFDAIAQTLEDDAIKDVEINKVLSEDNVFGNVGDDVDGLNDGFGGDDDDWLGSS